ncbi:MAG TPA: FliH/SctL family protein [Opitutales bacterium]|nr:FliH/SctL family protein [Opitutales bacterium]
MQSESASPRIHLRKPIAGMRVTYYGPEPVREAEANSREERAYQKGRRDADEACQRQILQARREMAQLQNEVLASVQTRFSELSAELDAALPDLVLAIVGKIWEGLTLSREDVLRAIDAALAEVGSDTKNLTLRLSKSDAALLQQKESFTERYPDITIATDPELKSGDVVLESRFGIVDSRISTRVSRVENELRKAHQ